MQHNLLEEDVIRVVCHGDGVRRANLPEVLALLGEDRVESFPGLALYQEHAWHAFLVQLAVLALVPAGIDEPRQSAVPWRDLLRGLTPDYPADEPWHLVVEDVSRPALFQPPVPEGSLAEFRTLIGRPDDLDILITAKNHSVKAGRMANDRPDLWLFSLMSLQTMQGFLGRGNYGIARMNGGFANRPAVSAVPSLWPGARFVREVKQLLTHRIQWFADQDYADEGGLGLTWLEPWDGRQALSLSRLDPLFIEVCRRVRLVTEEDPVTGGRIVARFRPSDGPRIAAATRKGVLGDPWAPIEVKKAGVQMLTVSGSGFDYRLLVDVLFENSSKRRNVKPSPLQSVDPDSEDAPDGLALYCQAVVRGQGETDGYHERTVPIPTETYPSLFGPRRQEAGAIAVAQVQEAAGVRGALSLALSVLLRAGKDGRDGKTVESWKKPWLERYDRAVDDGFFARLWPRLAANGSVETGDAAIAWLRNEAETLLRQAMESVPLPGVRRYRAMAAAESAFRHAFGKAFKGYARSPVTPDSDTTPESPHV